MIKPPFKLNGAVKATNFIIQEREAARRFAEMQAEAMRLGFVFIHDDMIVPSVDEQTEEQKAFLARLFKP